MIWDRFSTDLRRVTAAMALICLAGCGPAEQAGDDDDSDTDVNPCDLSHLEDALEDVPSGLPAAITDQIQAFHRGGQTFITWPEDNSVSGESYKVYRSTGAISASSLGSAALIATVAEGSGYFGNEVSIGNPYQSRYIITDLGPQLPAGVGLHVHTTREAGPLTEYYAVTVVKNGVEQTLQGNMTLFTGVLEQKSQPQPVRVYTNGLKTLYTHWMDYAAWNPRFEGYAYNFWVGTPPDAAAAGPLPVQMHLHAYGESWMRNWTEGDSYGSGSPYGLPVIWIEPDDHRNTWWYGFANNVSRNEPANASSVIVNYTEQRLLYLIEWITGASSPYKVDRDRVYLYGGSMGGSGTLSFGLRHPEIFAGIYALIPMTDESSSEWGRAGLDSLWGTVSMNLPTNEGVGVHDRMNTRQYVLDHSARLPYTVSLHGREDTIIEWSSQGLPWVLQHEIALAPGPKLWSNSDHSNTWDIFLKNPLPNYAFSAFTLKRSESYLVFTDAPGDDDPGGVIAACRGEDPYAYGYLRASVEWASSANPFMGFAAPTDTPTLWRTALRSRTDECNWPSGGTVTVTLYRTTSFRPAPGAQVFWENHGPGGGLIQSGAVTVSAKGLVTIPGVQVSTAGSVLTLSATEIGGGEDADLDGVTPGQGDCNDLDPATYPGAPEKCDALDNDCDSAVDEGAATAYFRDEDGDGYGGASSLDACTPPGGYVTTSGDCNDSDPQAFPGAAEVCDGGDDDCDGATDEGYNPTVWYFDGDLDTYGGPATLVACAQPPGYIARGGDCADSDALSYPDAPETCDGVDNDCDLVIDDGLSTTVWYQDADADGHGSGTVLEACAAPAGYADVAGDCDDGQATSFPGAAEICDGRDNDCDGMTDER